MLDKILKMLYTHLFMFNDSVFYNKEFDERRKNMSNIKLNADELKVLRIVLKEEPFQLPCPKAAKFSEYETILNRLLTKQVIKQESDGMWVSKLGKEVLGI